MGEARGAVGAGAAGAGGAGAAGAPNPDQPPQAAVGGGRGGNLIEPGVFKVTLLVDGKEVETKKLTVSPDPLFR